MDASKVIGNILGDRVSKNKMSNENLYAQGYKIVNRKHAAVPADNMTTTQLNNLVANVKSNEEADRKLKSVGYSLKKLKRVNEDMFR